MKKKKQKYINTLKDLLHVRFEETLDVDYEELIHSFNLLLSNSYNTPVKLNSLNNEFKLILQVANTENILRYCLRTDKFNNKKEFDLLNLDVYLLFNTFAFIEYFRDKVKEKDLQNKAMKISSNLLNSQIIVIEKL